MAEDLIASGAVEVADGYRLGSVGIIWPLYFEPNNVSYRYPAAEGDVFTLHQERGEGEILYGALDADGVEIWRPDGYQEPVRPYSKTFTMPAGTAYVVVSWRRSAKSEAPTLVKVSGGGASMSANLWSAENVTPAENPKDGIYACSGKQGVRTNVSLDRLAANRTFHCGFSVNSGADDAFSMALCYEDAAGNVNYAFTADTSVPAGKWTRVSQSVVVPSGMTVCQMVICNNRNASGTSGWKVTNPTLSLGSPVCLASSAHTPYATQDHVSATYATKASLNVLDDSIKAEVKTRIKTDKTVSELSSRLTQTADGLHVSIDRLSDTDKNINSWFDFDSDSSGNPQLKMGSSTSPVVGVYTNAGLAYKSRSGATLMELDASSQSSTLPHMHADDVSIGSWQWVPTQNGTHFTLQWIGG